MKQPLTSNQHALYSKLQGYFRANEHSPTLEELRELIGAKTINTVVQYLNALERKGYIVRRKHVKRNIELRDEDLRYATNTISVPVMASVGCDNLSVFANEQHDEFIEVDKKITGGRENVVAVRAIGDSMNDAGIKNGDYVLIEPTDHAETGDRVAAIVGDMVTVKKLEKHSGIMVLRPESKDPKYKPIVLSSDSKIAGKVICSIPGQGMDLTEVVPI